MRVIAGLLDLIIRGGRVITGAGNPWFTADVALKGGRIVEVGRVLGEAEEVIDASGLAVAPGFIDLHDHSDLTILVDRKAENKVRMGVSTIVFPNCGSGAAPLNEEMREELKRRAPYLAEAGIEVDWSTIDEYLTLIEQGGISVNVAPLVAYGSIRRYVMGMEMRPPKEEELEAMKREVERGMEVGCLGLTTGLRYTPQSYASTEEIIELARVVAQYGGFYASHIRDEGDLGNPISAVKEAIRIGEEAGVPVNISHIKILSKRLWNLCPRIIELIEEARRRGVNVTADQYPYNASGTGPGAWIPEWAHEGGLEALAERLRDPDIATRIKARLIEAMEERGGPEAVLISTYPLSPRLVGKTLKEIAEERGEDPGETLFKLYSQHVERLAAGEIQGGFSVINFNQSEKNIEMIMRQPWVAFGTDGRVHRPDGVLLRHVPNPHPRLYGTFPRILGRYVMERKVLTLEDAIRRMTSLPAQILGLRDRGLVLPGMWADIVVFDPDAVLDKAEYTPPQAAMRYPEGILHLLVNGILTLKDGEHTGAMAGRVLRSR
jgi:N-acyl-D-amino-acid deacylase